MKYILPKKITISNSSIGIYENADGTTNTPYNKLEAISGAGVVRQYNDRIYQTRVVIKPIVTFIWQDADPQNKYNFTTATEATDDGTAVSIVNGVTTVYVVSTNKYYISKTTGTVDFTAEDYATPANFNEVTDNSLRYDDLLPTEATLYWKDMGASNRTSSVSSAVNRATQSVGNTFWQEFQATGVSSIVLYNVQATSMSIEVRSVDTGGILYEEDRDLASLEFTSFREWFDSSMEEIEYESKIIINPDYYIIGQVITKITITNTAGDAMLGEILAGQLAEGGITVDGVPTPTETDSEIIQLENGDIIFEGEGDSTKVYRTMQLNLKIETASYDAYSRASLKIINNRILVIGENTDDPIYQTLILYGAVTRASPTLISNSTKSDMQIDVREFTTGVTS